MVYYPAKGNITKRSHPMISKRWAGALLVCTLLAGCRNTPKPEPEVATPASESTLRDMREEYQSRDANARIGVVAAVDENTRLALFEDVNLSEFKVDDAITFIDTK